MRIWVFRVAGPAGGNPSATCPIDFSAIMNQQALLVGHDGKQCVITDWNGCVDYVLQELVNHQRLRQGWGVPTLDLRLAEDIWIENYIIASKRYYNEDSGCEHATGRRSILKKMLEMNLGDVIFLPNVNGLERNEEYFSVCHVKGKYFFEDRSCLDNNWQKDFGHVIPISNLATYKYSGTTLSRSIFGAPYLRAIDEAQQSYQSYAAIKHFIDTFLV